MLRSVPKQIEQLQKQNKILIEIVKDMYFRAKKVDYWIKSANIEKLLKELQKDE